MNTVLAIVAHPDDEIIGVGGTLYKHVLNGDDVIALILGDGKSSRKKTYQPLQAKIKAETDNETEAALATLGINKFYREYLPDNRFDKLELLDIVKMISRYVTDIKPSIVYTHFFGDLNIDHQKTAEATIIACRPSENKSVKDLYMFETLSATEMSGPRSSTVFLPNMFVDIGQELPQKIKAMSCYKSELQDYPHPRSLKAIELNAQLWGIKNHMQPAEAFFIFKSVRS